MAEVKPLNPFESESNFGSVESAGENHEKINVERQSIHDIEATIAEANPGMAPAQVVSELDHYLIAKGKNIMQHPESAGYQSKILEAAGAIAVEGTDEYYGKESAGKNPISVWELEAHGEALYDVVKSYQEAGATTDAETMAQAIDGLEVTDGRMAGVEQEAAREKLHPNKLKAALGKAAMALTGLQPVIGVFGTVTTVTGNLKQHEYKSRLDEKHGHLSDTYQEHASDIAAYKQWKKTGELPERLPNDTLHKDALKNSFIYNEGYNPFTVNTEGKIPRITIGTEVMPQVALPPAESLNQTETPDPPSLEYKKQPFDTFIDLPDTARENILKSKQSKASYDQDFAESTYEISIGPVDAETPLTPEDIVRRFETDHVVKSAPELRRQSLDTSRTNKIVAVRGKTYALHTNTSLSLYKDDRKTSTEHEVLRDLEEYLQTAANAANEIGDHPANLAAEMLDKMTFIGKKEYDEATLGIADYWRAALEANPNLQVLAIAGRIDDKKVKSDEYLLDNILDNFTEEEHAKYAGRLITNEKDVRVTKPEDLKVVLLDDWTISGSQLKGARSTFNRDHPGFESSVEVQLVAANERRVKRGLEYLNYSAADNNRIATPVRAYYVAHDSDSAPTSRAHITGSHSSVDFDAEDLWADITRAANESGGIGDEQEIIMTMPSAANIVRPYRMEGVKLKNKSQLERYNKKERKL